MKIVAAVVLVLLLLFVVGACRVDPSMFKGPFTLAKQLDALEVPNRTERPAIRKRKNTKKAWSARLNRECLRRDRRISAVDPPEGGLKSLERYAGKVLEIQRRHIVALQSYEAPKGYETQAAFVLSAERQRADALQRVLDAAARGDRRAGELAVRMFEAVGRSSKGVFRSIGATACA